MIESCKKIYIEKRERLLFVLGLMVVSLIALPYVLLGEGSYVQIHDQVDGEILNYIYQAKYLLRGDTIPEFMNGMSKASMLPPAPLGVLLYKILPPFAAFALMHWICLLVGFVGMFFLCRYFKLRSEVCFAVSCMFCYIPFYPVYGLAALGQPLLIFAFLELLSGEKKLISVLIIAFYGSMSSLTLIGYVWIILGFLSVILLVVTKKKDAAIRAGIGLMVLVAVYLVTNIDLLCSLLGKGFSTHRSEMVLNATEDLWGRAKELLLTGGSYSPVYSAGILIFAVLFLLLGVVLLWQSSGDEKLLRCMKAVGGLLAVMCVCVLLAVLWNCQLIVDARVAIGGMAAYFQADRIYWTFPFIWMFVMAWVLEGLAVWGETGRWTSEIFAVVTKIMAYSLCVMLLLIEGLQIFRDNTLNKNLRLVLLDSYQQVTWESIYMEDVFDQIDEVIGEDKENVSVVSLGIYPSVPLYNGYTCADGYSNNYDLAYKHSFRKILAEELDKSPESRAYFDDWGNRLYLAAQPYGINGMVKKGGGISYESPALDVEAMKAMNIGYLFSAAPIDFSGDKAKDFELVSGSPFSDEDSYYEVWVYRLR